MNNPVAPLKNDGKISASASGDSGEARGRRGPNPFAHSNGGEGIYRRRYGGLPSRKEREREAELADFLGNEEQCAGVLSKLHPRARKVSDIVPDVLKNCLGRPNLSLFANLQAHWETILITKFNASHTRPLHLRGNTLEIEVSNASMLYALQDPMLQQQILARIVQTVGPRPVTAIRFVAPGR